MIDELASLSAHPGARARPGGASARKGTPREAHRGWWLPLTIQPRRARVGRRPMPRIGLVLGAGGSVGHAFHAGVLAGIADATGWDARDADVIVGTSAGAVVAALLRATVSPADLAARATDMPLSPDGRRLVARADSGRAHLPPIPTRPPRRAPSRDVIAERGRARCAAALGCALRRARGRGDARRSRTDRAGRGEPAARCSTVGPSSCCGSTPSRWIRVGASRSGATRVL